ncbi:MAG: acyl-CoA/acyl-ACP dehydrogenase [Deltaproteobacteria bacterium]|nr:acyl-CoA/acyl-ACP dehydrogenase [Deltaproteobacteria bacterium]
MQEFLLTEEEKKFKQESMEFAASVRPDLIRAMEKEEVKYPAEFVKEAASKGLLGSRFPKKWGGRGMSWAGEIAAIEEIGVLGSALGCLFSLPSIVGQALSDFGTDKQKEKYLKPILKGEIFCAEALTEPRGGSDFFGATCKAERHGDVYILDGQKRFVVGAEGADVFLVYARTAPPDVPGKNSISTFIVERDFGVKVEHLFGLLGARGGGTGRISFPRIEVPAENLVGPENSGAAAFNRMMVPERLTSAAGAIGSGRAALEVATRYSDKRKAFGRKIRRFEAVSFKVADAVTSLDAARALTLVAGRVADSGADPRRLVSEAKKAATEAAWSAVNNAMQVMGGIGYTDIFPVERLLRDLRLTMIWTGTNEIMSLLIQHEYFKELLDTGPVGRDVESDALNPDPDDEKVYE